MDEGLVGFGLLGGHAAELAEQLRGVSVSRAIRRNNHRSRKGAASPRERVPRVERFHRGTAKRNRAKIRPIRIERRGPWEGADRLGEHESRTRGQSPRARAGGPASGC